MPPFIFLVKYLCFIFEHTQSDFGIWIWTIYHLDSTDLHGWAFLETKGWSILGHKWPALVEQQQ